MGRKSNALQRREEVIWALYDCLAESGHEKVTIKSIAARAGLPPGVIHYYFKSKDEIVSCLAAAIVLKQRKTLDSQIRRARNSEERVDLIIDFLVGIVFDYRLNRVFYNLIHMGFERDFLNEVMKGMLGNYREQVTDVFKKAGAGMESPFLGAALVAVTEGFSIQLMVDPESFKKSDIRQLISQTVRFRLAMLNS